MRGSQTTENTAISGLLLSNICSAQVLYSLYCCSSVQLREIITFNTGRIREFKIPNLQTDLL